ncbi:MAG: hypothetical protein SVV80_14065, partial [Planctomycetota bacterium]|nr:hypothetical protein [Planctomycetota bacterium]
MKNVTIECVGGDIVRQDGFDVVVNAANAYYYNETYAQEFSSGHPMTASRTLFSGRRYRMDAKQIKQLKP